MDDQHDLGATYPRARTQKIVTFYFVWWYSFFQMEFQSLDLATEKHPSAPVAVDTTLLIAASSYVQDFGGRTDPRASKAFSGLATAFCNGSDLLLPLPRSAAGQSTMFRDLWQNRAAVMPLRNVELSDSGFEAIAEWGAPHFATYAEGSPSEVASWLSFHFGPSIADAHFGRADVQAVARFARVTYHLLSNGKLPNLTTAIYKLQEQRLMESPGYYEHLIGSSEIPSLLHLCVAYALSVSLRGYSYAAAIGQLPNAPLYRHHWVRSPIIRRFESAEMTTRVQAQLGAQFPWGDILAKVFDPKAPLCERQPERVGDILEHLRDRSPEVRAAMNEGFLQNPIDEDDTSRATDAEMFVLNMLLDAGIAPLYARSTFLERAMTVLRVVAKQNSTFSWLVELVSANLQSSWLRRPEAVVRLRFRRDEFWKVFDDPGVRVALKYGDADAIRD